ncbi:MAG: hypothetical protein ACXWC9_11220, partial [Pseudobdellovibrionaceae bacterium]
MAAVKRWFLILASFGLLVLIGYLFVQNYSIIFSRRVVGQIVDVKKIDTNIALMQITGQPQDKINPQMYASYAVAIKEKSGEIVTASAEDRQWEVAK